MAKPLYIDGLTQDQRTRYVRCAGLTGQKLNAWVAETLDREADRLLAFEKSVVDSPCNTPAWANGLSVRAVEVLQSAGLDSRQAVIDAVGEWTVAQWYAVPNCGRKVYDEVSSWIKN